MNKHKEARKNRREERTIEDWVLKNHNRVASEKMTQEQAASTCSSEAGCDVTKWKISKAWDVVIEKPWPPVKHGSRKGRSGYAKIGQLSASKLYAIASCLESMADSLGHPVPDAVRSMSASFESKDADDSAAATQDSDSGGGIIFENGRAGFKARLKG